MRHKRGRENSCTIAPAFPIHPSRILLHRCVCEMKARNSLSKIMEKWDAMTMMRPHRREDYEDDFSSPATKWPWRFTTSYRESLYSSSSSSGGGGGGGGGGRFLSCIKRRSGGASAGRSGGCGSLIRVLVGKDRQAFHVEPQILDHGVVQCLLERTRSSAAAAEEELGYDGDLLARRMSNGQSPLYEEDIRLDCDAILFDHILWLMHNDDPSLRNLNLDELMEFYAFD